VRQSNLYVLIFTAIMTVVIGGLLSVTNQVLKPAQLKSIELDTKTSILAAVMSIKKGEDDVLAIYDAQIRGLVVDIDGSEMHTNDKGEALQADKVNVLRNFKKDPAIREYPVYKFAKAENPGATEAYIFPIYGNGLWNGIFGYLALEKDLNTIKGVSFGHVAETPGLGARISTPEIQDRYIGKKIFDENGNLTPITMKKGEKRDPSAFGEHEVDGMSGATLTAKGVNAMLDQYLHSYEKYIKNVKEQESI
jgi:Na+-transporting NADH:ubiquinone oxidoreductase subunit C